jgi:hypothetical protein
MKLEIFLFFRNEWGLVGPTASPRGALMPSLYGGYADSPSLSARYYRSRTLDGAVSLSSDQTLSLAAPSVGFHDISHTDISHKVSLAQETFATSDSTNMDNSYMRFSNMRHFPHITTLPPYPQTPHTHHQKSFLHNIWL